MSPHTGKAWRPPSLEQKEYKCQKRLTVTCPSLSSKNRSTPTGGELVKYEKKKSFFANNTTIKKRETAKVT